MKKLALFTLTTLVLAGCQTVTSPSNPAVIVKKPTETMLCTMQYDPVCGKVANSTGLFNYKTYGNACTARNNPDNVVSYTHGACGAEK